jgi:predicted esterase
MFEDLQGSLTHMRVVCPTAPTQPVTINAGMEMPSWHDIRSLSKLDPADFKGLDESVRRVQRMLDAQVAAGIASEHIVLGGFSQGAAVSVLAGLTYPRKLGGIVCLSGYLPVRAEFGKQVSEANKKTPVLVCHGDWDNVVPIEQGRRCHEELVKAGVPAEFRLYRNMGHSACDQEMKEVFAFVAKFCKV